jgi:integrase
MVVDRVPAPDLQAVIEQAVKQALAQAGVVPANSNGHDGSSPFSDNLDLVADASTKGKPMRRYNGPYPHKKKFRVIEVDIATKERTLHAFDTRDEALAAMERMQREEARTGGATVRQTLEAYREALLGKGNRESSIKTTFYRLNALFAALLERPMKALSKADLESALDGISGQAGDSRLNITAEARTFLRWCHRKGHTRQDLGFFLQVEAKRKHGKPQLRIDEARKWLEVAETKAASGDVSATAAMLTLLMGMRVSEVSGRTVRDLDDSGKQLWIPEAKTRAGVRRLSVPEGLREHLLRLADGRPGDAPLFPGVSRHTINATVKRICGEAGVPVVPAHGMRGLHATLAVSAGATSNLVAQSLGHESFAITEKCYASPDAVSAARQVAVSGELALSPSSPGTRTKAAA